MNHVENVSAVLLGSVVYLAVLLAVALERPRSPRRRGRHRRDLRAGAW